MTSIFRINISTIIDSLYKLPPILRIINETNAIKPDFLKLPDGLRRLAYS